MRRIRYGMIGGGKDSFIGAVHRAAMRLDDGWSFVCGALSSTPEKSRASGTDAGLPQDRVYATWQEMIEGESKRDPAERMECVVIVTPNHVHAEPAIAAMKAGFHVVCDKPLCTTLADAERIADVVRETGRVFAVTYNYSGYPLVKQARRMVADGVIGPVRKVLVEYNQGWLATRLEDTGQKQAGWRTDPKRAGAGALGDIGSHAEQLTRHITGLELDSICADVTTFVPGRPIDDDASVLLRFKDRGGARAKGVLVASQVCVGHLNDLRIRIYGETGSLEWHQEDPNTLTHNALEGPTRVYHRGDGGLCDEAQAATRLPTGHPEAFYEAFANIYRGARLAILGEKSPAIDHPTIEDGVRGIRFIAKALECAAGGGAWTAV
ncbi:MAG: Gfo/Idh/MocA family oxidoreductase [Phycisphaeraceae bacterium]|nr:MAG: Gfo/Idh/MocA family oxidoreductase [Phycisphaeraceae bacterium]